jgi:glucokinase
MPSLAIAVDIGGSGVRVSRVGPSGLTGEMHRVDITRDVGRTELIELIKHGISAVSLGRESALGVAIPSFVNSDGTVGPCPSVPALEGMDLGGALGAGRVVPDLAAAALGESRYGAGRGIQRFLCVALGTGANAAAIVDGAQVETAFGCLGDAGHVLVDPEGPECPCGGRGCLEAIASGYALARDGNPLGLNDGRAVIEAAREGRQEAIELLERAGTALGRALATWSVLIWPQLAAIGGGLSSAGELLLAPARKELARVGTPYVVSALEVVTATLGPDATLVGTGIAALESPTHPAIRRKSADPGLKR